MNDLYAETSVKKKQTLSIVVLKISGIVIAILSLLLTIRFGTIMGIASAVFIVFLIWYWPRFKIEWEYVFCDGQLDFDMVMGGEKRKTILRVEASEADVIAPIDSEKLAGYQHLNKKDFTSLTPNAKVYGMPVKVKDEKILIRFEPSEKMLEKMKLKSNNVEIG